MDYIIFNNVCFQDNHHHFSQANLESYVITGGTKSAIIGYFRN